MYAEEIEKSEQKVKLFYHSRCQLRSCMQMNVQFAAFLSKSICYLNQQSHREERIKSQKIQSMIY